jgi:hypothetical protein
MQSIQDIRKALKPLGYTVKTKSLSFGCSATYVHKASGEALPEIHSASAHVEFVARWGALMEWRKAHVDALRALRVSIGVYGLA